MLQLALTIIIFLIIVIPVGRYMYHIATWNHTLADPVFDRLDGVIYKIGGVNPHQGMNWRQYALALVGTNAVMVAIGYLILRIQSVGIFNPNSIGNMEPTLAFNTIISFMTNTNLQHYSGESGLSYLSQMLVIIFMMFVSAASGYAACIAFIRGLTGKTKDDVGNFFADLTRITTRLLLPFSIVGGLLLVWQGVPQNFDANIVVNTLEGTFQTIAMGPIAALEIIKHLGTNGGGFFNVNADVVAGHVAAAIGAHKVFFLTDVDGLYRDFDDKSTLISRISLDEVREMVDKKQVSTGMIPKLRSCIRALDAGVHRAHILNGTTPHALLLEMLTDKGVGTMIVPPDGDAAFDSTREGSFASKLV